MPAAPAAPTATAASASQIDLMWDTVVGATHYRLERSTIVDSGYVPVTGGATTSTSYMDMNLIGSTEYFYKVRACADGSSVDTCSPGSVAGSDTTQVPAMPDMPTTRVLGATRIELTWTRVPGATWYRLYSSDAMNGTYMEITAAAGAGTTYTDIGPALQHRILLQSGGLRRQHQGLFRTV